jgi:uncharacterized protein (DUF697 family)
MPEGATTYEDKVREVNTLRGQLAQKERDLSTERKAALELRKTATHHPQCEAIINRYALISAAVGLLPMPGLDMAALTGIQIKMIDSLAEHFGKNYTEAQGRHTLTALTGGVATPLAGQAIANAVMFVPFAGPIVAFAARPAAAAASTRMVGHLALERFEREQGPGAFEHIEAAGPEGGSSAKEGSTGG